MPWQHPTVRLDTYSGAPVDFAAFEADPAEVLVAGSTRIHAIDTSNRKAVARWKFTPPPGYQLVSNDVELPLQNHEGFFVIEARRGDAAQQTWVNVSRIGLVTKEAPEGWLLYGTDLSNGQPLRGMRVTLLVGGRFVYEKTNGDGILHGVPGAKFALADWGASHAFVSIASQPPLPQAIVVVRTDRGAVRAGEALRVVGFARKRDGKAMRPMAGEVRVNALVGGRSVASTTLALGASGGFSGTLAIPADVPAGDLSVLASAGGASGGSTVHVDAAGDVTLTIQARCASPCGAQSAIPVKVVARRRNVAAPGLPVAIRVVRSPHVVPSDENDADSWGTTAIVDTTVTTGPDGSATLTLPGPSDGLSSTYGIAASSENATTAARVVVPNAATVLRIVPEETSLDVGQEARFDVRGFGASDDRPAAGRSVRVVLTKGPDVQEQTVELDAAGRAEAVFPTPELGTDVATAAFGDDASGLDATAVTVAPRALGARANRRGGEIAISLDKDRYKLGDHAAVTASLDGAVGTALLTVEGARVSDLRLVPVSGGRVTADLSLDGAAGAVRIGVAMVKDGAVWTGDLPVAIDGPGYPRKTELSADRDTYAPGATAHISIDDGGDAGASLLAIRISDAPPIGGAAFTDAPAILAAGGTTTQNPAARDPEWHAYVAPAGSKAQDIFGAARPGGVSTRESSLSISASRALVWKVGVDERSSFDVPLPAERGSYVLSVLKISSDGDVGAASLALSVQ